MGMEIERKFLVKGEGWREGARRERIRQGYLNRDPERAVRVRTKGERGYLTVKGMGRGVARAEFEYEIPVADADAMLDTLAVRPLIEKTRHHVVHAGKAWEVDEFEGENAGLVVAEVELASESEAFEAPSWLGEEVSHDARYFNQSLASRPYRTWKA